ncbi:MAG: SRPBCC family protein [Spirochaetes bacterium]|nr:SRPBCC family protein [Spirochaetota bacterium]
MLKYRTEIIIDLPRSRLAELMDSFENLKKWQPDLISYENIEGKPGDKGTKTLLKYNMNRKQVDMIETIINRNFPDEFSALYEAKGVKNWVTNSFIPITENQTKWQCENIFQFSGVMAILSVFMRSAFNKQTKEYMDFFKKFAENEK